MPFGSGVAFFSRRENSLNCSLFFFRLSTHSTYHDGASKSSRKRRKCVDNQNGCYVMFTFGLRFDSFHRKLAQIVPFLKTIAENANEISWMNLPGESFSMESRFLEQFSRFAGTERCLTASNMPKQRLVLPAPSTNCEIKHFIYHFRLIPDK